MSRSMSKNAVVLLVAFSLGALLSLSSHAQTDSQKKQIEARVKPVGTVCTEGDTSCGSTAAAAVSSKSDLKVGKKIYESTCHMCHATGVAGAPKFGNKADWKPRIAEGLATLHQHALHGYKAMPPKGTCSSCTDAEIKDAVNYMVSHSK